jgi:arylsulfatase A-like enzyme
VVRGDLLDYALEIEWFDRLLGQMLALLEAAGELDNTLVAVTGDNGLPFPRAKANLYDNGTHVPLAVRWGARAPGGRVVEDFVSLADLAPTFLEAAGVARPRAMTARSLVDLLASRKAGWVEPERDHVLCGRERHSMAQPDGEGGYPMRSIRTRDFLYVRNYRPERYPAGVDTRKPNAYRDVDPGPTKQYMMEHRAEPGVANLFELGFGKRPPEELYDLRSDAGEQRNLARQESAAAVKARLAAQLDQQLKAWRDPRATGGGQEFDRYPYYGSRDPVGLFDKGAAEKK